MNRSPPLLRLVRRPHREMVRVGGVRFHTRSCDEAPPEAPTIVLVHGAGVSSRYMTPLMVHLAPHFRVLAPDLPGFGLSEKPRGVLDVDELADALLAWMDALALPRVVLLGNSVGCQITVALAARHPERVSHAILVGPTMDPSAPTMLRQGIRFAATAFVEPPSLLAVVLLEYANAGALRFVRTVRAAMRDPFEQKLAAVQAPTLVVRGARDLIVKQPWAARVAALLPRGRLTLLKQGGHAANYDAPRELARLVCAFAGGARATAPPPPADRPDAPAADPSRR